MSTGIWINERTFKEFAESTVTRRELVDEIATRQAAYDWPGMLGLLPDLDPVLAKRGEGAEILDELTGDSHVTAQIQTRKIGTLKREWKFVPGTLNEDKTTPAAEKLMQDLAEDLERVDMYNLIAQILDAPLYGYAPLEIKWQAGRGRIRIRDIEAKPHRWFGFDDDNQPRFISANAPWEGELLPFGKFVFARHFPTYDNPYGLRLLSRCFWPVHFKKGGIRFWMTFAEKFGMPFLVGYHRPGAEKDEKDTMLAGLVKMVRDAVAVVPDGGRVEMLERKGNANGELYERLKNAMDAEISKVLVGQTLTAEIGDKGSYAASKTHQDVLADYQAADQIMVKTVMEEIAWVYGLVNSPGTPPPVWDWFEDEEPRQEFAERDKNLKDTGVRFLKPYYTRRYNLKEDEFELEEKAAEGQGNLEAKRPQPLEGKQPVDKNDDQPQEFAEPVAEPDLADLLTEKMAPGLDAETSLWVDRVRELVMTAGSLEEIRDRLIELDLPAERFAEILTLGVCGADLAGRIEVADGE